MSLRQRIEALAANYEAEAHKYETMAQPERASSLEDQVECRREANRARIHAKELREALEGAE